MKKLTILLGMILAISVLSGFRCYGQEDVSVIWGCYQKDQGQLRIVSSPDLCRPQEVPISWNQVGPGVPVPNSITVDCSNNQTISQALEITPGKPLTITLVGICNENVEIVRDDVTLIADPSGGTINGPDPTKDTVKVRASRTVMDGLTVTGGRNGIDVAFGSTQIQNCTVQNTGRNGIVFYHGGNGSVDKCTVQNNVSHGIYIEAGSTTVTYSTISSNATGIKVNLGGSARIGITDRGEYAGNMIYNNQGTGVHIFAGASAFIGGNTITGNGTDERSGWGQSGILIANASADLVGYNTITGNHGSGVYAKSSSVQIGDPGLGLPTRNTITGNGIGTYSITGKDGVFGFLGTSLDIRNADISNNTGNGVTLETFSTARMREDTVNNNTGDGISLRNDAVLNLQTPKVMSTGILRCIGNSYYTGDATGISGGLYGCALPCGIDVTPFPLAYAPAGGTVQFTATAKDCRGNIIQPPPVFSWRSDNPSIATVDQTGLVTMHDGVYGTCAEIWATAQGVIGGTFYSVGNRSFVSIPDGPLCPPQW